MELSWAIRTLDGDKAGCDARWGLSDASVELRGQPVDVAGNVVGPRTFSWRCDKLQGSTDFDVPPGRWSFDVGVICADQSQTAQVGVPDPIVRDVVRGQVVELNALLILVDPVTWPGCVATPDAGAPDAEEFDAAADAA